MTRTSPTLLRLAAVRNAIASPMPAHHRQAITAGSYRHLLTEGEAWFLGAVLRLPELTERQLARLRGICSKVERGRR